jgi:hypothetical protein
MFVVGYSVIAVERRPLSVQRALVADRFQSAAALAGRADRRNRTSRRGSPRALRSPCQHDAAIHAGASVHRPARRTHQVDPAPATRLGGNVPDGPSPLRRRRRVRLHDGAVAGAVRDEVACSRTAVARSTGLVAEQRAGRRRRIVAHTQSISPPVGKREPRVAFDVAERSRRERCLDLTGCAGGDRVRDRMQALSGAGRPIVCPATNNCVHLR